MPGSPTRACGIRSPTTSWPPAGAWSPATCAASAAPRSRPGSSPTRPTCSPCSTISRSTASRSSARPSAACRRSTSRCAPPSASPALVLLGSALDEFDESPALDALDAAEEARVEAGDLDAAAEANVRFWVRPRRRPAADVDPAVVALVRTMQRDAFDAQIGVDAELEEPDPPVARRLGEIGVPALVIVGADDVEDFVRLGERLAGELPGAGPLVRSRAPRTCRRSSAPTRSRRRLASSAERRRPQSSMCEPMTIVRSSGRPKYGTGSAALRAIAGTASCATVAIPGASVGDDRDARDEVRDAVEVDLATPCLVGAAAQRRRARRSCPGSRSGRSGG